MHQQYRQSTFLEETRGSSGHAVRSLHNINWSS